MVAPKLGKSGVNTTRTGYWLEYKLVGSESNYGTDRFWGGGEGRPGGYDSIGDMWFIAEGTSDYDEVLSRPWKPSTGFTGTPAPVAPGVNAHTGDFKWLPESASGTLLDILLARGSQNKARHSINVRWKCCSDMSTGKQSGGAEVVPGESGSNQSDREESLALRSPGASECKTRCDPD